MGTKDLEKRITRIFYADGEGVYDARRVYQLLFKELSKLEKKRICSIKRVQKIMHRLGLISCHRAKYRPTPSQQKI